MRLGVLLAGLACVASVAHANQPPTKLRFVFSAEDKVQRDVYLAAAKRFEAANPGIHVEAVPQLWAGYGVHDAFVRFLGYEDPSVDVLIVDTPWIPEFAWPGWLLPLDDYFGAEELARFDAAALSGGRYQGRLYGLPSSHKGNLLFYRKDVLDAAGLEPPKTIGQLARDARTLQTTLGQPFPVALHGLYVHCDVVPFLWASGGDVLDGERLVLDSPENARALRAVADLYLGEPPVVRQLAEWADDYHAPVRAFCRGEASYLVAWSSDRYHLAQPDCVSRGNVGIAAIPGLEPGPGVSNVGVWQVAVSAHTRHREAAVALARYLVSEREQLERLAVGEVPSLEALWTHPETVRQIPEVAELAAILSTGRLRPRVPNEREVDGLLEAELVRVLGGTASPEEALAAAARDIARTLETVAPAPETEPLTLGEAPVVGRSRTPLMVAAGLIVALLALLGVLAFLQVRLGVQLLTSISHKLVVFGAAVILVLVLVATGLITAHTIAEQEWELAESRRFYRQQLEEFARTTGKNLALTSSIVSDLTGDDQPWGAGDQHAMSHLLMARNFSEDLLFVQLLDRAGQVRSSGRDTLFIEDAGPNPYPPTAKTPALAARPTLVVQDATGADGTEHVEVIVPVFRRGVHQGALRLGVDKSRYLGRLAEAQARHDAAVSEIVRLAGFVALGLLLLGLFTIIALSRYLTRPIEDLTAKATEIRAGNLDVEFAPETSDEVGTLTHAMADMVDGLKQRDRIQNAFGRYVTPELADRFMNDPTSLELGGHLETVTILMSDVRGFTALSERLGPEETVKALNRYLGAMSDVIHAHDGTINEFIGDAILVLFGTPVAHDDDPLRAVRCAVDMQRAMADFNAEITGAGLPPLGMGIGVNTGEVIAGNIGSEQHVKYGVVGEPVNMTARIESLTVGGQVFISPDTLALVREQVEVREPIGVQVKGRSEPLQVYDVVGMKNGSQVPPPFAEPETAVEVDARVFEMQGKTVSETAVAGRLSKLGLEACILTTTLGLAPLDNVKMQLKLGDSWSDDVYAKVMRQGGGGELTLTFTSLSKPDRDAVEALTG